MGADALNHPDLLFEGETSDLPHPTEPQFENMSYYWYDRDGRRHGPYHNYASAAHGKAKWEAAGLD